MKRRFYTMPTIFVNIDTGEIVENPEEYNYKEIETRKGNQVNDFQVITQHYKSIKIYGKREKQLKLF